MFCDKNVDLSFHHVPQKEAPVPQKKASVPQKGAPVPQKEAFVPQKETFPPQRGAHLSQKRHFVFTQPNLCLTKCFVPRIPDARMQHFLTP